MSEKLAQRELPANYKERSLLRDRIRESIPECPELEFKFILGRHKDESDAEFSSKNFADSDIVLIEGPALDIADFNGLMLELEQNKKDLNEILDELKKAEFKINFPEHFDKLLVLAHEQGKIIRCADISYAEAADMDYIFSEINKLADRVKSERLTFDKFMKEIEACIELDLEAQLFREKNIDRNMENVIIEVLNSHRELLQRKTLKISINIGALHSSLMQAFEIRKENVNSVLQKKVLPYTHPLDIAYNYLLYTGKIPEELLIQFGLYVILVKYLNIDDAPKATLGILRKISEDEDLIKRIYDTFMSEDAPAEKLREIVSGI